MLRSTTIAVGILVLGVFAPTSLRAAGSELDVSLQTRGPDGKIVVSSEKIDPQRVGVVVVDMWNFHWCKTATMRVDALVPRMNKALDAARELGMTVMLCPSDVVDNYVGWPQRERIFAMPQHAVPTLAKIECPAPPNGGGCACGRERCVVNYGWDAMHPALRIDRADLMPDTLQDVYSICRERGLTHLVYMGVHTQVCLLGKPMGLKNLKAAGLKCILARDLTDAHPGYDPSRGFTPDGHTDEVVEHFEKFLSPSINLADELTKAGKWDRTWVVDPVRITPWGTSLRPHLFEQEVTVTLCAPWQPKAEIRYTLDGSKPSESSPLYGKPLTLQDTTWIRVAAFEKDRRVCLDSEGSFVQLLPVPPAPDVHLSDLKPRRTVGPSHTFGETARYSAHSQPPQNDKTNEGAPLQLRGKAYAKGLGVHAPCQVQYELRPEYARFVGLAGVDERILQTANGSNRAMRPSVVFKVFIDGEEAAASPVMRISEQPWRFNVPIPQGAKLLSLAVSDAGNGNQEDLANWVEAGFIRQ